MFWLLALFLSPAFAAAPVPGNVAATNFQPAIVGAVTISSQTVASSSVRIFAPNGKRKRVECWTLCANTADVHISWGASALTTDAPLEACSYWSTELVISTRSLNAIAASGSQVIRCLEY